MVLKGIKIRIIKSAALAIVGCTLFGVSPANATLIGQDITCTAADPFFAYACSPTSVNSSATVGAGLEFDMHFTATGEDRWNVDFDASSVVISMTRTTELSTGGVPPNIFGDLFWAGDPTATLIAIANFQIVGSVSGFDATNITVADHSITVFWDGTWAVGSSVSFDLVTTHSTSVPEPVTLALFGIGLAGMGFARRRKKA